LLTLHVKTHGPGTWTERLHKAAAQVRAERKLVKRFDPFDQYWSKCGHGQSGWFTSQERLKGWVFDQY
jgi:hypothetical protein